MTDNTDKLMAEALVECGYALKQKKLSDGNYYIYLDMSNSGNYIREHPANPFADTLEGRKQADALEDLLHKEYYSLIQQAKVAEMLQKDSPNNDFMGQYNGRQKRLNRIEWCFKQLAMNMLWSIQNEQK